MSAVLRERSRHAPAGFDRVALALVLLGAVLRLLWLGQQSFWHDEIHSMINARGGDSGTLAETIANTHGPLYLLVLRGWLHLSGPGEGPVRLLSALCGIVGLVLFHRVLRRFVDRGTANVGLVLLALSPYHLAYSQEARGYALLFALGLVSVEACLDDLERRSVRTFVAALVSIAATCLSNLSGFFLLPVVGILAWTSARRQRYPLRRFALMAVLLAVLLAPWIKGGAESTGKISIGTPSPHSDVILAKGESPPGLLSIPYSIYDFSLGRSLGPSVDDMKLHRFAAVKPHLWYLVPAAALVGVLLLLGLLGAKATVREVMLPWLVLPIVLMAVFSVLNLKAANSRYAFLSFGPFVAWLAIGITTLNARVLRALALAAVLALFAWSDVQYFTNPYYWKPDARAAGRLLSREARADDAVLVYALDYPVRYYTPPAIALVVPPDAVFASDSSAAGWLAANTAGRRVWLVQCESWWLDRGEHMRHAAQRTRPHDGEWHFDHLPVYRFGPGSAP